MKPTINTAIPALLLWLMPLTAPAQPYHIPGAAQQPAWVFPIWFENANGDKDTLYLGYDKSANNFLGGSDTIFGEKIGRIDLADFNVYWCSKWNDSSSKVIVSKLENNSQCGDAIFIIEATQGWLPIKMSWDVSLFRSDSLPFPDKSPAPRAEGLIWFNGIADADTTGWICSSWGDNPILVSDTGFEGNAACMRTDSVVFTELYSLAFQVRAWQGYWVGVDENQAIKHTVSISPNPFTEKAILVFEGYQPRNRYMVRIYDLVGREITRLPLHGNTIEINRNGSPNGIYFFTITENNTRIHSGKFIIH